MSTIIIPGGGALGGGLGQTLSTLINLVILYYLFMFVRQNFDSLKKNEPIDFKKTMAKMNIKI